MKTFIALALLMTAIAVGLASWSGDPRGTELALAPPSTPSAGAAIAEAAPELEIAAAPAPARSAPAEVRVPPSEDPLEPGLVPLEKLLDWQTEYRPEPAGLRLEPPDDPTQDSSTSGIGAKVRIRHHSEEIGPKGPDRREVGDAEVGVAVPVNESVSVKGGVRVEYDRDPNTRRTEVDSMPTVGVEVQF